MYHKIFLLDLRFTMKFRKKLHEYENQLLTSQKDLQLKCSEANELSIQNEGFLAALALKDIEIEGLSKNATEKSTVRIQINERKVACYFYEL